MAAMEAEAIRGLLVQAFPDAVELTVEDRTGTGDHFQVDVTSPSFDGLSLVDQHRRPQLFPRKRLGVQCRGPAAQHQPPIRRTLGTLNDQDA